MGPPDQVLDPGLLGRVYGVPMQAVARDGACPVVVPVL
jgi:hypothetical protein